jgi:hypothetical protein
MFQRHTNYSPNSALQMINVLKPSIKELSPYLTRNTLRLHNKAQPVNAV